jgi:hypothetical protein
VLSLRRDRALKSNGTVERIIPFNSPPATVLFPGVSRARMENRCEPFAQIRNLGGATVVEEGSAPIWTADLENF